MGENFSTMKRETLLFICAPKTPQLRVVSIKANHHAVTFGTKLTAWNTWGHGTADLLYDSKRVHPASAGQARAAKANGSSLTTPVCQTSLAHGLSNQALLDTNPDRSTNFT
jgi:hypothetical protein